MGDGPAVASTESSSVQRVGLLGGTFDPPHFGHLWLAETARDQLRLDKVLFLPVGQPPHKTGNRVTSASHRLAMIELAIAGNPYFELDLTDFQRPVPHTTYTLLPLIQSRLPGARLWLIIGSDSLRDLPNWREPRQVLSGCRLAVLSRPGVAFDWRALQKDIPGVRDAVDLLGGPTLDISSTEIRQRIEDGRTIRYLLPAAVLGYVQREKLYR